MITNLLIYFSVRAEKQTQPLGGNSKRRILSIVSIFVFIMAVSMCAKCKVGKCTRHQQPEAVSTSLSTLWIKAIHFN